MVRGVCIIVSKRVFLVDFPFSSRGVGAASGGGRGPQCAPGRAEAENRTPPVCRYVQIYVVVYSLWWGLVKFMSWDWICGGG